MSENSSKNAEALRRELRRRRILENAENRLRTITGKENTTKCDESILIRAEDTCFQTHHNDFHNEIHDDILKEISQEVTGERKALEEYQTWTETLNYNSHEELLTNKKASVEKSYFQSFIQKRFHYVILPIIIRCLFFFKLGFLFYNNIFCPFITVKLMEFMLLQESLQSDKQNILSVLLSKGHIITYMWKAYSMITSLLSDFFLYIFTFILSDKLFRAVNESHLN